MTYTYCVEWDVKPYTLTHLLLTVLAYVAYFYTLNPSLYRVLHKETIQV